MVSNLAKLILVLTAATFVVGIFGSFASAITNTESPSACSGQWTSCTYANADDSKSATAEAKANTVKTGTWSGYAIVPSSAVVDSVVVKPKFSASQSSGYMDVSVSGDGGQTYGPAHRVGGNTAVQTFLIDVTNDLSWTPDKVNNLVVKSTCLKSGNGKNPICNLEWLPADIAYTPFDFSLSASPSSSSVTPARGTSTTVTVDLLGGVSQNVDLLLSGCPTGATCSINPIAGSPAYTSTLTVDTSSATPAGNYNILVTGTGDGKTKSTNYGLTVTDSLPEASASAAPTSGVAPITIQFSGSVLGGDGPVTYLWNFGDGVTSTALSPSHLYSTPGTYSTTFTATDYDGDSSTKTLIIVVKAPFDFSLSASPATGTASQGRSASATVAATLLSGDTQLVTLSQSGCPVSATCTFATTTSSPTFNTEFIVTAGTTTPAGNYPITITGVSGELTKSSTFTVTITDSQPVASVSATPTTGVKPVSVSFTGSVAGGDGPLSYLWNFGDATTSTAQNPSHTFTAEGTYLVAFTVTDFDGDASSSTVTITATDSQPVASASATPTSGVRPLAVSFTGSVAGGDGPLTYLWAFGDATTSTEQSPQHIYSVAGTYIATFTVTDVHGDTSSSSVTITSTDSQPAATASATPTSGVTPLTVSFTGAVAGGDAPVTYLWDFKDGTTSALQNPQHVYTTAGTFNAAFTVTDVHGDTSTSSVLVTVNEPFDFSVSARPASTSVAQARSTGANVTVGLLSGTSQSVALSISGCPLATTCSFETPSGFPTFVSILNVVTTNATLTGPHTITITGTGDGKSRGADYTFTVTDSQPVTNASATPISGAAPLAVAFTGSLSGGDSPVSLLWNFGDGTTSTLLSPQHTFNSAGVYDVTFTATDYDGDVSISHVLITATNSIPIASAAATPTSGNSPLTVNFTGLVSGGDNPLTFSWDFKDGATSTEQNPQHTFAAAGIYNVSFTVTDANSDASVSYIFINVTNATAPFNFSVLVNPASKNAARNTNASTNVTVTLLSGASQFVTLSHSGCPVGASCSFTPILGQPTYNSLFYVATTNSTPAGNYSITITGTGGGMNRSAIYRLSVV